jgi:tetratricopeptide (TPR) repeat protein
MRVARVHCVYGRLELAQRCYWNVIQGSPARPEAGCAVSHLALLAMERREYARGLSQMEQVARRYPKTPAALRAQMAIPMIHLAEGKPDRAITAYSAVAKRYPGTEAAVEAQFTMAEIHQAHGDIKRAVAAGWKPAALEALLEAYRKGVHVDPDRDRKSKYSLHVADLYSSLQRWAEARAAANEVLKLDPPDKRQFILRRRRARDVIADTYYRQGLYQEALALYEELLAECISQPQEALLGSTAEPVEREGYQRWIEEIRQVQSQALPGETPAEQAARLQEEER